MFQYRGQHLTCFEQETELQTEVQVSSGALCLTSVLKVSCSISCYFSGVFFYFVILEQGFIMGIDFLAFPQFSVPLKHLAL